jgi:hypothetical protein
VQLLHFPGNFQGRDAAVGEIERVARRGGVRGLEISRQSDRMPLSDPWWNPMRDAVGIDHVIVNGTVLLENGALPWPAPRRPSATLTHPALCGLGPPSPALRERVPTRIASGGGG